MMLAVYAACAEIESKAISNAQNGHFVQGQKKEDTINRNCHMDIKE